MKKEVFTVGHSNHTIESFLNLLEKFKIEVIADVRSSPYSKIYDQFNYNPLKSKLKERGIKYVFLGKELGARSEDPSCYEDGKVRYGLLEKTELFKKGVVRLKKGMDEYRVCLMCAEKDPIECHRMILVSKHLKSEGIEVFHILKDGGLESEDDALKRLREELGLFTLNLFEPDQELDIKAYKMQEDKIAYKVE